MTVPSEAVLTVEYVRKAVADVPPHSRARWRLAVEPHRPTLDTAIPVELVRGGDLHPLVLLMAGMHGDEYEGVFAAHRVSAELDPATMHGSALVVPVANQLAIAFGGRLQPTDFTDLNRAFPGDPAGLPIQRIAAALFELTAETDLLYSLHSWSRTGTVVPHVEIGTSGGPAQIRSQDAALATGLPYVLRTSWPPGLLVREVLDAGTPCIEAEIGGYGMATDEGVRAYSDSIMRVLAHAGVTATTAAPETTAPRVVAPLDVRVDHSGLVLRHAAVGQAVEAGARLATVVDLFGQVLQEVAAPCDAVVGTVRTVGALNAGDRVFTLFVRAAFESTADPTRTEVPR